MSADRRAWEGRLDRRAFLGRAGTVALGAALTQLVPALRGRGWMDEARASDLELTRDTMNGLAAFALPGPDAYSVAQGETSPTPGGVDARAADNLIQNLDNFVSAPAIGSFTTGRAVPVSGAVASMLDATAAQVDPTATAGPFPSHFSRLAMAGKAEVFRRLESTPGEDDLTRTIRYVATALPPLAALCCYHDWHTFDPATRTLRARPVGWDAANYYPGRLAPADGWPELRGYYRGRRQARRTEREAS